MIKYIIGTKDCMTQIFDADGVVTPATILFVAPHTVTAVKTIDTDGYEAVQVATRDQNPSRVAKAQHTLPGGVKKFIREATPNVMRGETLEGFSIGATFDVSLFTIGDTVTVSAISKGKGFQGVVKRHGFKGDKATHGRKRTHRAPGSIGGGGRAGGRVVKGKKMAGRMGGDQVTVKNLKIVQVNPAAGILVVKGAVPGHKGTLVEVRGV